MRRPSEATARGRAAETAAAAFLTERGYRVLQRNLRLPGGEIDLVCLDGRTVVFVEVKSRATATYGSALAAVDARKRARLRAVAADHAQIVAPGLPLRFDVVTVEGGRITHHRGAF
jgi:putative endonuclease